MSIAIPLLGLGIALAILVGVGAAWILSSANRSGDKHHNESHANR